MINWRICGRICALVPRLINIVSPLSISLTQDISDACGHRGITFHLRIDGSVCLESTTLLLLQVHAGGGERCVRAVPPTVIERVRCHIAHAPRAGLPPLRRRRRLRCAHEAGLEQEAALVQLLIGQRQVEVTGDGIGILVRDYVADRLPETVRAQDLWKGRCRCL